MTKSTDNTGMASPYFDSSKVAKGVYPGNYDSAADGKSTPAGGYIKPSEIRERAGTHWRPSLVGDSPVRR
jgi:hypothetical protein